MGKDKGQGLPNSEVQQKWRSSELRTLTQVRVL